MVQTPVVGIVGRLVTGSDAWSGIPHGLAAGMAAHGIETVFVSAEPTERVILAVRRHLRRVRRLTPHWQQSPEMICVRAALVRARLRRMQLPGIRWVQMGSEFGVPLRSDFVTFEDMTVASALRIPAFPGADMDAVTARYWVRTQRRIYHHASRCCVASRWQAESLIGDYGVDPDRVRVVGLGRNVILDATEKDWSRPRYLFVGLDWRRKNGAAVVRAFRRLRETIPYARLDVVGDHPLLVEAGVQTHGHLRHSVPAERAQLAELFAASTCFVMPSAYEPFGIVYAEAGAAGVPSIATCLGGTRDAVGEGGGVFVDPGEEEQLVAAMLRLADPRIARELGEEARRHAARLTWPRVAERVLSALGLVEGEQQLVGLPASVAGG